MIRWFLVAIVVLAGCAPQPRATTEAELAAARAYVAGPQQMDPGWLAAQEANRIARGEGPMSTSLAARDQVMGNEVVRALRAGQPMQPIINRYVEANIRDRLAPAPMRGRVTVEGERQRLTTLALAAVTARNESDRMMARSRDEQQRREAYCRDLAADIGIAGSNSGELFVGMLTGVPSVQETSLYRSCISGFARTDAYLAR